MGKQILITGTNSYVGTSFKQYIEKKNGNMPLEDRWHVTFVSVRNSEWKKMDFSKYDTILHVAAIVHQKEQPEMEALYYAVNTKLTEELADKAKAERARQFVFLSTMSVYGMTMAGSGDMLNAMINLVAERGIADRFHFPGFMKGKQVYEVYKNSDVFVMPSVSEPFGIAPLEAMQCGTPSIISKQSGCGEILDKVIKTDYWDIHAMADAIYSLCTNQSLFEYLRDEGKKEVDGITWEKVGLRIRALYEDVLRNYGK